MRILVKYFPPYNYIIGIREEVIVVPNDIKVKDFLLFLASKYPRLKEFVNLESDEKQMNRMVLVQNGEFLKLNDSLSEGVIMILAPIAGG